MRLLFLAFGLSLLLPGTGAMAQVVASGQRTQVSPATGPAKAAATTSVSLRQFLKQCASRYQTTIAFADEVVGEKTVMPPNTEVSLEALLTTVLPQVGLTFKKLPPIIT